MVETGRHGQLREAAAPHITRGPLCIRDVSASVHDNLYRLCTLWPPVPRTPRTDPAPAIATSALGPLSAPRKEAMPDPTDPIRDQVLAVAQRELSLGPTELAQLTDDTDLSEHLDSVQRLTLVVGIEDHFEICFEPEDDDQAVTLADVTRIVRRRMVSPTATP